MNKNLWFVFVMMLSLTLPGVLYAEKAPETSAKEAVSEVETAVPAETQNAENLLEAVKAEEAEVVFKVWLKTPPMVKVSPFGTEIKINVNFDPKMGKEKIEAIQSVKLETDKGEFLGLKTYSPEETSREAEFMVSPEALKIDKVKVIVSSSLDGSYSTAASLVIPQEEPKTEAAASAETAKDAMAAAVPEKKAKGKKKGWGW